MKALLVADTHWLWYAAGRWGKRNRVSRPRVDYMRLRNEVAQLLKDRWGAVYDLECVAFVVSQGDSGMEHFIRVLRGFGFAVHSCSGDATPVIVEALKSERWDLAALAVGSVEVIAATEAGRREGRRVIAVGFDVVYDQKLVDAALQLDSGVLYEG